jgi:phosphatidylserine/phosphatidylglycerophosphate/cardiolipin synthase-like enzyme
MDGGAVTAGGTHVRTDRSGAAPGRGAPRPTQSAPGAGKARARRPHGDARLALTALALTACAACSPPPSAPPDPRACAALAAERSPPLSAELAPFADRLGHQTGALVLDASAPALLTRAHLSEAAERSIDVQYFIFTADNVGKLATDFLLRAAERGVHVRLLIDDILADADGLALQALDAHPHLEVRIYNPSVNTGKSLTGKLSAVASDFRGVNQRMHNKTFVVDGQVAITGGRNVADEYFDYDHEYNFRDRDVLLLGDGASQVQRSFDTFWNSRLAVPVATLLEPEPGTDHAAFARELHRYACDPANFWPEVREQLRELPRAFDAIAHSAELQWVRGVRFVSDAPGKNDGSSGLGGGGLTTDTLRELLRGAHKQVLIQTPYLVTTAPTRRLFADAVRRGVQVKVLTNSLASTDNPEAFNGYQRDRAALLATGIHVFEWRPDAEVRRRLMKSALVQRMDEPPVFAVHAKTMIVDGERLVVGTFNLDPRSANLNTECFAIIPSATLADEVRRRFAEETRAENAWHVTPGWNPDTTAGVWKRVNAWTRGVLPKSIL